MRRNTDNLTLIRTPIDAGQAPEPDAERSPSPDLDPKRPSDGASKEPIVATPPKTGESLAHDMPVKDNLEKISPAD